MQVILLNCLEMDLIVVKRFVFIFLFSMFLQIDAPSAFLQAHP